MNKAKDAAPVFSTEGHRERLRERYRTGGASALLDYEKLELFLTFVNRRGDVKPQAKALLARFGSLSGVMNATEKELLEISGVGPNTAVLFRLMRELYEQFLLEKIEHRDILRETSDTLRYARLKLGGFRREAFLVIYLNTRNEAIGSEILAEGTIDELYIHPRELFTHALECSARSIILFHNHPSGEPTPSTEDVRFTQAVLAAGRAVRIDLLDHLVVTHNTCFSIFTGTRIDLDGEGADFHFSVPPAAEEASARTRLPRASAKKYDPLNFVHLAGIVKSSYRTCSGLPGEKEGKGGKP